MNRRNFLGGLALTTLTPTISIAEEKEKHSPSVIFIFLGGGIAQQEFINPIPNAPVEYRSSCGSINHVDGFQLGGDFANLAKIPLTVVRSMQHRDSNHETATNWMISSESNFAMNNPWPSYGSVISKKVGTNTENGTPVYVKLNRIDGDGAQFLGTKYMGYDANEAGVSNLFLNVPQNQFNIRKRMLDVIDRRSDGTGIQMYEDWRQLRDQAVTIIEGDAAKAFDLSHEDQAVVSEFKTGFGRDLLRAARLAQCGSKFISVNFGGWDHHANIASAFKDKAQELDFYLHKLYLLLKHKDILENTLVVVTSEFSRTKINSSAGRDHNSNTNSLIFFGANAQSRVIGKTDAHALVSEEQIFTPKDLSWTIFNHLKLEKHFPIIDNGGRPRELIDLEAKDILTT